MYLINCANRHLISLIKILSFKIHMIVVLIKGKYVILSHRVLTHDNGKVTPLTVSIIGSNRKMSGVKFSVYNIEDS